MSERRQLSMPGQFLPLEVGTTASELATHLLGLLEAESGQGIAMMRLVWETLIYYVPVAYQNSSGMHGERPAHCDTLLDLLGYLLFNGDPKKGMEKLKENSTPQQMCGRVFRNGESTYLCLDCGVDMTCVLCSQCFQNSEHKKHSYRMAASGGSGCCDCGDEEAWKSHPHCKLHPAAGADTKAEVGIDPALQERARAVLSQCLRYCVETLTFKDAVAPDWCTGEKHCLLLYNDEVHTFDEIIKILKHDHTLRVSTDAAANLATIIDRDGRLPVIVASKDECLKMKKNILDIKLHGGLKPDVVLKVFPHSLVVHQIFAISLLAWLENLSVTCGALQTIMRDTMLRGSLAQPHSATPASEASTLIIDRVLSVGNVLWKVSRCEFQSFVMSLMTSDTHQKVDFAIKFLEHYQRIEEQYLEDDHDHSMSMASLSVQFFTVPTVAYTLMDNHDAFYKITQFVVDRLHACRNSDGVLALAEHQNTVDMQRFCYVVEDTRYLLCHPPLAWTDERRAWFLRGFGNVVQIYLELEGVESFRRKEDEHVLYEKEWEESFSFMLHYNSVLRRLVKWIRSDEKLTHLCLKHIMDVLCKLTQYRYTVLEILSVRQRPGSSTPPSKTSGYVTGDCLRLSVSVHWPLRRLLARIMTCRDVDVALLFSEDAKKLSGADLNTPPSSDMLRPVTAQCIMEHPLRTYIVAQQVLAGMWRRNGHSVYSMMVHYESPSCCMCDADLALFQVCGTLIEPDIFIDTLLSRLMLLRTPERVILHNVEIFFRILLNIIGERYDNNVARNVTDRMRIERELVHALFLGALTHSEAVKEGTSTPALFANPTGEKDHRLVEEVLKTVAERKTSRTGQTAEYHLKDEYFSQCTPFYYHHNKQQQSKVHMRGRGVKDWVGLTPLPVFRPRLEPVLSIMSSDSLHKFIAYSLHACTNLEAKLWNEQTLHQTLYLIGMMCQEEDLYARQVAGRNKDQLKFSFMQAMIEKTFAISDNVSIFSLLVKLQDTDRADEYKALLQRVIEMLSANKKKLLPDQGQTLTLSGVDAVDGNTPVVETPKSPRTTAEEEKAERKKKAAAQRAKAMQRMQDLQRTFLATDEAEHAASAGAASEASSAVSAAAAAAAATGGDDPMSTSSCAVASAAEAVQPPSVMKLMCILCQEEEEVTSENAAMVMPGYCGISRVVGVDQLMTPASLSEFDAILCPSNLPFGVHVNCCGHAMHASCHAEWLRTESQKRRHSQPASQTYRCPMCNNVGNLAMPVFPRRVAQLPGRSINMSRSLSTLASAITARLLQPASQSPSQESIDSDTGSASGLQRCRRRSGSTGFTTTLAKAYRYFADRRGRRSVPSQSEEATGPDSLIDLLRDFAGGVQKRLGSSNTESESVDTLGSSLGYGIMCLERLLHSELRSVFGELSCRLNDPYEVLTGLGFEARSELAHSSGKPTVITPSERRLLSVVARLLSSDDVALDRLPSFDTRVFHLEPFHLMVQLSLLFNQFSQSLEADVIQARGLADWWPLNRMECTLVALHLALIVQVVQILIVATPEKLLEMPVSESVEELPSQCILHLWTALKSHNLLKHWQPMLQQSEVTEQRLVMYVQQELVPFLSRAALFLRFQGHPLPPPTADGWENYASLAKFLGLPESISDVMAEQLCGTDSALSRWMSVLESADKASDSPVDTCPAKVARTSSNIHVPGVRGLSQLPNDYSDFIQRVSTLECPQAVHDSTLNKLVKHPAMCLICGEFLCAMTYCCRKDPNCGNLSYHAQMCGGEIGIFLLVWDCKVMILAPPLGMLQAVPYLDEYGETASAGGRTINPLFLDATLLNDLQAVWQRHGFIEKVWTFSDQQGHQYIHNHWNDM
eukprot:scpid28768/ scgid27715/ E3 ubiquitin-protein ligase UBR2; N-recognin-2; Ubiquitin-protein ligase E3-alpha-2; Ubiquitin-protein ligase E3-alpha-II